LAAGGLLPATPACAQGVFERDDSARPTPQKKDIARHGRANDHREGLNALAGKKFDAGYRLLTLSCVDLGQAGFDILYHFDKDLRLEHYG
jgi:hypothetical protein